MIKNHKVSFVSVWAFLLMSLTVLSQNQKIDSLKRIVETGAKDTTMVITLNNLGLELLNQGDMSLFKIRVDPPFQALASLSVDVQPQRTYKYHREH